MKKTKLSIFIILMFTVSLIFSQYTYFYYGKSKVLKHRFDWSYMETQNYKIYYYTSDTQLIKKLARVAEQTYERLSNYLNMEVKEKIPVIFYNSHIDFEQTNLFPGFIPMGAVAFAEPVGHRVVIQGDSSFEELSRTFSHEIGHIFEYEIFYKKISGGTTSFVRPPNWVFEGFSELATQNWSSFSLVTVRDTVLNDRMPTIGKQGGFQGRYQNVRTDYDFGHLLFDFIEEKYGKRGVRNLLNSFKGGSVLGRKRNIFRIFDLSQKQFNFEFRKYARNKFKKFLTKENPEDYSFVIGPDFPYAYSFSHQISPAGELVAVLTANYKDLKIDIILISMKTGKMIKNITPGFTSKYDNISLTFNPVDGSSFSWDKKGEKIAFFARKELTNYLVIVDILSGKILKRVKLIDIQNPTSPDFSPDNKFIYFSGMKTTKSHIYKYSLETDEIKKQTEGLLYIKALNISPDGKQIVFSAKTKNYYKLYIGPLENPETATQITSGNYNDITPVFSNDSKSILYSSDELEPYNIYSIDLENKLIYRHSDIRTGNFFPIEIPGEKNQVVLSSYHKGSFLLFKKDISTHLEKREIEFSGKPKIVADSSLKKPIEKKEEKKETPVQKKSKPVIETGEVKDSTIPKIQADIQSKPDTKIIGSGKYKPFGKLFINASPTIAGGFGTDGSFYGYSYLTLTDLMSDHFFRLLISSMYGYRSYDALYLNRRNRLQYFARLFYFNQAYYAYGSDKYYHITMRRQYGARAGLLYPFSRSYRASMSLSLFRQTERFDELYYGVDLPYGQFFSGPVFNVQASITGETTRFANYGPNRGHTFHFNFTKYISLGSTFQDAYVIEGDLRKYLRLNNKTLLAFRLFGTNSGGKNPLIYWIGGNNTIRSVGFRRWSGTNTFFFNAEFRFPLIDLAATPIGLLGPVRGVLFFDVGAAWFDEQEFRILEKGKFKLKDAIASYGFGIEFFMFGLPIHLDWVYTTNFDEKKYLGIEFWIGLDF